LARLYQTNKERTMRNKITVLLITLLVLTPGGSFSSETAAPKVLIDKGACPFECCAYRKWKTEVNAIAYAGPDRNSEIIGTFRVGTTVEGLTGEVHARPVRFVVKKRHAEYRPGDVLWVYTYLGEGYFKVWYKGKMFEEDLGFSPYGGSPGKRCEQHSAYCWGELERELSFTWWVKVKSSEGWVGWSDRPENFSNKDECG
jgi:hypothetical protein